MNTPILVSTVALALAAGSLALTLGAPRQGAGPAAPSGVDALPTRSVDGLLSKGIAELTEENRALRERIVALEMGAVDMRDRQPAADSAFVPRAEFDAFRDQVLGALGDPSTLSAGIAARPEVLKEQVTEAVAELRKSETMKQIEDRQSKQVDRLDEIMPKFEEQLGLTSDQSNRMRSALLTRYEREAELTRRWREGEDPEVLGQIKGSDRQSHLDELGTFLTTDQLERYSSRRGGK